MNKKGGITLGFSDIIWLIMLVGVALVFLGFVFFQLPGKAAQQAQAELGELHAKEAALFHLRIDQHNGVDFRGEDIRAKISYSKVLAGEIIVECSGYTLESDCTNDIVNIHPADSGYWCEWEVTECVRKGEGPTTII